MANVKEDSNINAVKKKIIALTNDLEKYHEASVKAENESKLSKDNAETAELECQRNKELLAQTTKSLEATTAEKAQLEAKLQILERETETVQVEFNSLRNKVKNAEDEEETAA